MALARNLKEKIASLTPEEIDRMVRMGWEDRTTFEAIEKQFAMSENQFVRFMRVQLSPEVFKRWRKRIHRHGHLKQGKKRGFKTTRFKCSRQSVDGITKGWK